MKRIVYFLSIFAFSVTLTLAAEEKKGIVAVSNLRMRGTPDLKGNVVTLLDRGSIVTILEESVKKLKVEGNEAPWLKVRYNSHTGWLFGGYITTDYHCFDRGCNTVSWSRTVQNATSEYGYITEISLYNRTNKTLYRIDASPETAWYSFSKNLKYLAIDAGTDGVGNISFYRIHDGKVLHSSSFSPRGITWDGNKVKYHSVLCMDDGFTIYEEQVFNDGKIEKTGIYGKGEYHFGVEIGGCRKYLQLLKKKREK